eukprot:CAMPEP_0184698922 /NCGR_PEP_ID=MMETSP0313-20130426/5367_1 /TAXON_ID=2792 /ORGANISM="Porphyridium aerugineum, Strain SAG 1380-2" /LENGTH=42 /DNA_ID= /DNA_START= /DNA_END= /DNA_ORIENTATION=
MASIPIDPSLWDRNKRALFLPVRALSMSAQGTMDVPAFVEKE